MYGLPVVPPPGRNPYRAWHTEVNGKPFVQLYADRDNGQDTSLADDHSRHVRPMWIPHAISNDPANAIINAARAFCGPPVVKTGWPDSRTTNLWADADYFSRPLPMPHPSFPNMLYAESLQGFRGEKPMPKPSTLDANGQMLFDELQLSLVFGMPMGERLSDGDLVKAIAKRGGPPAWFPDESSLLRNVFPNEQTAGKFQTLPSYATLRWVDGTKTTKPGGDQYGTPMVNQLSAIIPEADLTIVWGPVPLTAYPETAINQCIGCTNQYPLGHPNSFFRIYRPGTLVMLPPGKLIRRLLTGDYELFISYKFKIYPKGANTFLRADAVKGGRATVVWQRATRTGLADGDTFYPFANFNNLFRPETYVNSVWNPKEETWDDNGQDPIQEPTWNMRAP